IHIRGTDIPLLDEQIKDDKNAHLVAIVGTRKASDYAKKIARELASELAQRNIGIVSGFAFGIDIEAHKGALDADARTYAVLAHGLDTIYPSDHLRYSDEILRKGGALISEYPTHTPVKPFRFLARNRIISALSDAVVVIEAPKKSGAVHTGFFALAQKKKLFVLPGASYSSAYEGSHELLRAGGRVFASCRHLLSDLGLFSGNTKD